MSMSTIGVPLEGFGVYCRAAAAEGAVLLKNEGHMFPLKKEEMVSVFGRCQFETYRSGTGSGGAVNVPYAVNIYDGMRESGSFTLNEELADIYRAWLKDHPFDNGGGGWAAEPWHQKEMVITEEIAAAAAEKSEKAIFIIGRTAGEDKDYANEAGSYLLTPEELENLKVLTAHFEQVAVLLNVSNIIDMSWLKNPVYKDHIRSVLYIWQGGMEETADHLLFNANIPTEEIYSAPKADAVNGTVYSTKPLVYNGNLIDKFHLTFKDGKVVAAAAETGEDVLKKLIAIDEGACRLGEVALIPYHSPISLSGILFYETLFDENASCHLALGASYPTCLTGGADMDKDAIAAAGLNDSMIHVDFMVGSPDLTITGTKADGTTVPVFTHGDWAQ